MNIEQILPIASQFVGRDLTGEFQAFQRSKMAIGAALNQEGQIFLSQHWRGIPDFLETPEGRKAITEFLDAWVIQLHDKYRASLPKVPLSPQEQPQQ